MRAGEREDPCPAALGCETDTEPLAGPLYLSVDLDYWMHLRRPPLRFFERLSQCVKEIVLVRSHENLLPHINHAGKELGVRHLINVDTHSDFPGGCHGRDKIWLDDGTWSMFVEWRSKGHFEWRRPRVRGSFDAGDCSGGFCLPFHRSHRACTEWRSCEHKIGTGGIPWDRIVAAGVAISLPYLNIGACGLLQKRMIKEARRLAAFGCDSLALPADEFCRALVNGLRAREQQES